MSLAHILLVGTGGAMGAVLRYLVSQIVNKNYTFQLPVATLLVNLLGSFLLGLLLSLELAESWNLLLGVGIMGAFTTFSTFKLEGIQLHANKKWKVFLQYNLISYGGGIFLAYAGFLLGGFMQ
ncbi:fluoride efflux transporter CrcB [Halobacillus massiliensis]|uniref:fluoride efflux transporter CrcB n=1 Tax=Halobacillus massiliensis TaxID=1926286 RepID=UPI0009E2EBA5|nr:fluoride efflux transporter CrcB [Halobacillus massiliensis]